MKFYLYLNIFSCSTSVTPLVTECQDITQVKSTSDRRQSCLEDSSKAYKREHRMNDTSFKETVSIDIHKESVRFLIDKQQEPGFQVT